MGADIARRLNENDFEAYSYDAAGRLTSLSETGGAVLANLHYDNFGRPLARGYAVAYTNIGYDPASRVESLLHDLGGTSADQLIGLAYNPVGQITARSMTNEAYVSNSAYPVSRGYSVNGLNQYTAAGPANFQYDGNGNMRSDGTTNFVYDAENRLVSANGVQNATLAYDPLGRLFSVTGASGTTQFLYDGDALVAEYDGAGTLLRRYVHGSNAAADDPLIWYEGSNGTPRGLFSDHQGTIVAVAAVDGTPLAIAAYDAWGIPNAGAVGVGAGRVGRFGYTGQAWIPELGMWHYKARIYSPTLGRFLQTDPVGYDDQINLYAYVGNDPVNHTDPTGEALVVGAVIGAGFELANQMVLEGRSISEVDWIDVGISAAAGASGYGIISGGNKYLRAQGTIARAENRIARARESASRATGAARRQRTADQIRRAQASRAQGQRRATTAASATAAVAVGSNAAQRAAPNPNEARGNGNEQPQRSGERALPSPTEVVREAVSNILGSIKCLVRVGCD